jgi:hypothetical protein
MLMAQAAAIALASAEWLAKISGAWRLNSRIDPPCLTPATWCQYQERSFDIA